MAEMDEMMSDANTSNDHLKRLFLQLVPGLTLSRSRPYHKNDNRFVEQKREQTRASGWGRRGRCSSLKAAPAGVVFTDQSAALRHHLPPTLRRLVNGKE